MQHRTTKTFRFIEIKLCLLVTCFWLSSLQAAFTGISYAPHDMPEFIEAIDPIIHRLLEKSPNPALRVKNIVAGRQVTTASIGKCYSTEAACDVIIRWSVNEVRSFMGGSTSQDEMAGTIAHELSHHFLDHLNLAFFSRLIDAFAPPPSKQQFEADHFGLLLTRSAGFDPSDYLLSLQGFAENWDSRALASVGLRSTRDRVNYLENLFEKDEINEALQGPLSLDVRATDIPAASKVRNAVETICKNQIWADEGFLRVHVGQDSGNELRASLQHGCRGITDKGREVVHMRRTSFQNQRARQLNSWQIEIELPGDSTERTETLLDDTISGVSSIRIFFISRLFEPSLSKYVAVAQFKY